MYPVHQAQFSKRRLLQAVDGFDARLRLAADINQYYDLERLWRNAERIEFHEPGGPTAARPKSHDERHNESEGNVTQQ